MGQREMIVSCLLLQSRTHIVSLLLLLLRPLVHAQASASGLSQPVHRQWHEKPEEILKQQLIWLVGMKPSLDKEVRYLKQGEAETVGVNERMLERMILNKKDRLFVNKRGEERERRAEARDKQAYEHPFKLFNLRFPQTRGGQRSPRGFQIEPRGGQVVKNKGWMLEKALK